MRLPTPTRWRLAAENPSPRQIADRMNLFAATQHCPPPRHVFSPAELPPAGGLLIPYVAGRKLRLPADLPLVADCLAALHQTQPGANQPDIIKTIEERMPLLSQAPMEEASRILIGNLWERTRALLAKRVARLTMDDAILADAQPGNFVVSSDDRAIVVDIEGDFAHSPAVDLAHITLFSSLLWWDEAAEPLQSEDIISFYQDYINKRGLFHSFAELLALRPLILCRTLSWMFHFLALASSGAVTASAAMIARAGSILRRDNLEKLLMKEEELL